MRQNADGSVTFPNRGIAPKAPSGYIKDPLDPFVFWPIVKKCKHRTLQIIDLSCCGGGMRKDLYCDFFKKKITLTICRDCPYAE